MMCPILSNPTVAKEFNEIKELSSETAAYYIWDKNGGYGIDRAPNGRPSNLFNKCLEWANGDRGLATRLKIEYYLKSFLKLFGDWTKGEGNKLAIDENGEPTIPHRRALVRRYLEALKPHVRPFRRRNDNFDFNETPERMIMTYVADKLGVYIDLENETDARGKIDFFLHNLLQEEIDKKIQSLRDKLDTVDTILEDAYISNISKFLERKDINAIYDYLEKDQLFIRTHFPKLFGKETESDIQKMFGYYKHLLRSENNDINRAMRALIKAHNLQLLIAKKQINKLEKTKKFLESYPGAILTIKESVFSELSRFEEWDAWRKKELTNLSKLSYSTVENARNGKNETNLADFVAGMMIPGNKYSAKEILLSLKQSFPKQQTEFVDQILKTLEKRGDVPIYAVDQMPHENIGAFYDPEYGAVVFPVLQQSTASNANEFLIHELTHAITSNYLTQNDEVALNVSKYALYVSQQVRKMMGSGMMTNFALALIYGIKVNYAHEAATGHEFIAEFFANEGFRDLLKQIPPMENNQFLSLFHLLIDWLAGVLGFKETYANAYEQALDFVQGVVEMERYSITSLPDFNNDLFYHYSYDEKGRLDKTNPNYARLHNSLLPVQRDDLLTKEQDEFVTQEIKNQEQTEKPLNERVHEAKKKWIEQKQKSILGDTQIALANAFGLEIQYGEDGRAFFVSTDENGEVLLRIDFLDYLETGQQGYYDYNSVSEAAHKLIAISLLEGDPSTFNHELAHHYVRMFWNSDLIQTALAAVYEDGMTNEEMEEALVDVITEKTTDALYNSAVESDSVFHKFWSAFSSLLHKVFNIQNEQYKQDVLNNVARAFSVNEKQELLDSEVAVYEMANKRMNKLTKRRSKINKAREEARTQKNKSGYTFNDTTENVSDVSSNIGKTISRIVQGTIDRNKSYRKNAILNPRLLTAMLIAENKVRQFVEDIKQYRKLFIENSQKPSDKKQIGVWERLKTRTSEELNRNVLLIRDFLQSCALEMNDAVAKLKAAQNYNYLKYASREIINENGDVEIRYVDNPVGDENITDISTQDLVDMNQNIISFYRNIFVDLRNSVQSDDFKNTYGEDVQRSLLYGDGDGVGILESSLEFSKVEMAYRTALASRLSTEIVNYIENEPGMTREQKDQEITSIKCYLNEQFVFGDVSAISRWVNMSSFSQSPLIRLIQDIINEDTAKIEAAEDDRGNKLMRLRQKALNAMRWKNPFKFLLGATLFNLEKLFMEKDESGLPTGNFLQRINRGRFELKKDEFFNDLLYGKNGVEKRIRDYLDDQTFELDIDETGDPLFPDGTEHIEKLYLKEINNWYGKNAIRRFTPAYYEKRIDMLSRKTRRKQAEIQNGITKLMLACTIDGKPRTDLLTNQQHLDLMRLYYEKDLLSNPYDEFGRLKDGDDLEIAQELTKWNEWVGLNVNYEIDNDSYEEAKSHAKNKEAFERKNTYRQINPVIWQKLQSLSTQTSSVRLDELRRERGKLVSIIKTRGYTLPDLSQVFDLETGQIRPGYEEFFENLKRIDQEIANELSKLNKLLRGRSASKQLYDQLMVSDSITIQDNLGRRKLWTQAIRESVQRRIEQDHPNDPLNTTRVDQYMLQFYSVQNGKQQPLSVFKLRKPKVSANQQGPVLVKINGQIHDAIVLLPIQAYSVIDVANSNPDYVDTRFNEKDEHSILPKEYDENGKSMYINEKYIKYIENGPSALRRYYEELIKTMKMSYKNIPSAGKFDYKLPQQGATLGQMLSRNWFNSGWKDYFKRKFYITDDDNTNIEYETRPDGTRSQYIPIRWLRRLDNPRMINSDVLGSVTDFYKMSENYKTRQQSLPLVQSLMEPGLERVRKGHGKSELLKTIEGMVERQYYGVTRKVSDSDDAGKKLKTGFLDTILPAIRTLTTKGLLALNVFAGIDAFFDPLLEISTFLGSKLFSVGDFIYGSLRLFGQFFKGLAGIGNHRSYGSIAVGMEHFGLQKKSFKNTHKGRIGKFIKDGITMRFFRAGEYMVDSVVCSILMSSYRYVDGLYLNKALYIDYIMKRDGVSKWRANLHRNMNTHTLYEAYDVIKGKMVPKRNKFGRAITDKKHIEICKLMKDSKMRIGKIVPEDQRTLIQTYVYSAFCVVCRTWMMVGFGDAFRHGHDFLIDPDYNFNNDATSGTQSEQLAGLSDKLLLKYSDLAGMYNFSTGVIENGYLYSFFYKGLWKGLVRAAKLTRYAFNKEKRDRVEKYSFSSADKDAVVRLLNIILIMLMVSISASLFHKYVADDEKYKDDYWILALDLILTRLAVTRTSPVDVSQVYELISSLSASTGDLKKKAAVIDLILDSYTGFSQHGTNFEQWDKVTGNSPYKGDPKAFRDLMYTLSSLGTHNAYASGTTKGIENRYRFYGDKYEKSILSSAFDRMINPDRYKEKLKKSNKKEKYIPTY